MQAIGACAGSRSVEVDSSRIGMCSASGARTYDHSSGSRTSRSTPPCSSTSCAASSTEICFATPSVCPVIQTIESVLQQSCDQRVDDIVAGLAAGWYDGLGLVEELAQDVGGNVHRVATVSAVELEHHATVITWADAHRAVARRFLDAVPQEVTQDGPLAAGKGGMVRLRGQRQDHGERVVRVPQHSEDGEVPVATQAGVVDDHVSCDLAVHRVASGLQRKAAFRWR